MTALTPNHRPTGSDYSRLLSMFDGGLLVRPDAAVPNTVDLSRALAAIGGAPQFESEAGTAGIRALVGVPRHLVFVLADGLGMNLVERLPPNAFLRRHLAFEIGAVFPSSTAPALTSLATGLWPAAHAVPSWFTYLPSAGLSGVVLPFTERRSGRDLQRHYGVDPGHVFPSGPRSPDSVGLTGHSCPRGFRTLLTRVT